MFEYIYAFSNINTKFTDIFIVYTIGFGSDIFM